MQRSFHIVSRTTFYITSNADATIRGHCRHSCSAVRQSEEIIGGSETINIVASYRRKDDNRIHFSTRLNPPHTIGVVADHIENLDNFLYKK